MLAAGQTHVVLPPNASTDMSLFLQHSNFLPNLHCSVRKDCLGNSWGRFVMRRGKELIYADCTRELLVVSRSLVFCITVIHYCKP
ncbi:hypothetical protein HBH98_158980 [Parastagonospora nodorum]|nr:hypothetical protein HBH52_117180 [Parastagonospora nodorum]KAH3984722.1 hypothetical protein HBH51_031480 [Parastagonospora nodorum]KAH4000409.1 hypothetical protein HBI10_104230 [Parastagonospora nodorum]KAH4026368.1 hypothetical protein HBI13_061390 [Parastagonospora nodorum]KAH4052162.1 hypothetical protein HBH49_112740 [Parastagonospora nodorum]